MTTLPQTFGDLRRSPWAEAPLRGRSVRDEIRANLLRLLSSRRRRSFPASSAMKTRSCRSWCTPCSPGITSSCSALRGQAKSRILRQLTRLLDPVMPIVAGSEINDDPFAPISRYARERLAQRATPRRLPGSGRDQRYVEKLATPDVTVADLIGDVDPIKAARGGHILADELTHALRAAAAGQSRHLRDQRAARPVAARSRWACSTSCRKATSRSKAIRSGCRSTCCWRSPPIPRTTPRAARSSRRSRTGSGREIVDPLSRVPWNWAWRSPRRKRGSSAVTGRWSIPDFVLEVIERVAFEAREDKRVDKRSGVSQRLPISVLEHAVSSAERRALHASASPTVVPRISDIYMALPSITGKLELEYEGELQGAETIAKELIRRAAGTTLDERLGDLALDSDRDLVRQRGRAQGAGRRAECGLPRAAIGWCRGWWKRRSKGDLAAPDDDAMLVAACELILEGLAAEKRISRSEELGYTRLRPERRDPR